ncbi:MAG: DUF924 domain-containing protein [Candidatus Omnitrophica bacterium]|nr:DUF924 domain-containing protein [Candidatus Omnitrophota bacterium]
MMERVAAILDYWFDGITEETQLLENLTVKNRWFAHDDSVDQDIKKKFGSDLTKARKGKYSSWMETSVGSLALIVLLDQYSRNIYRNSAKAFDTDLQALEYCFLAIKSNFDEELSLIQRQFLYMPMMHSENLRIQGKSVEYFRNLAEVSESLEPHNTEYYQSVLEYAQRHYDIIARFERFPHRNDVLKRRSTSTEIEFLKSPGASF